MRAKVIILSLVLALMYVTAFTQVNEKMTAKESVEFENRWFIGSSVFILFNAIPDQQNPPDFFQLNFGYWLTDKDVISLEAITWKYNAPLGIPYGDSYENSDEEYPGAIREFGVGVAYQRYIWNDVYFGQHILPMFRTYLDEDDKKIQNGFQLFCTSRIGYHLRLFGDNWFIEPSLAATYWPIKTNVPKEFEEMDDEWNSYFLFEPGLHFGYKF